MTSVFRLISRNFDPPATVRNVGVRPSRYGRGARIEDVDAGLMALLTENMRRLEAEERREARQI